MDTDTSENKTSSVTASGLPGAPVPVAALPYSPADTQRTASTTLAPPTIQNSKLSIEHSASPIGADGRGLSIIIPAYNEGESISMVLGKVRALKPAAEVIVVDDGSS